MQEGQADQETARQELKEGYLYDPVAQKGQKATDEEHVRQEMIRALVAEYGYPSASTETECRIKVGSSSRSVDIAIFACVAVATQPRLYLVDGDEVLETWDVVAR